MAIDLRSMFQTWLKVLTKPGVDVFEAERLKPAATLTTALVWIVLAGAVSTLLGLLHARLYPSFSMDMWPFSSLMPAEFLAAWEEIPARSQIQILSGVLTAPIVFIISVGIQHLLASQLGMDRIRLGPSGEKRFGKFGRYAYLNATFGAPLSIISPLLDFLPLLNYMAIPHPGHLPARAYLLCYASGIPTAPRSSDLRNLGGTDFRWWRVGFIVGRSLTIQGSAADLPARLRRG